MQGWSGTNVVYLGAYQLLTVWPTTLRHTHQTARPVQLARQAVHAAVERGAQCNRTNLGGSGTPVKANRLLVQANRLVCGKPQCKA
jgi:hypothetical protein